MKQIMRYNNLLGHLINPDPNGMYVRYEDVRDLLADGGKGEAVYQVLEPCEATWSDVDWLTYESTDGAFKRVLYTAPQAECAPREAQPVCWITREQLAKVGDESEDAWVYWAETGHVAEPDEIALYAAPTPERADADTADYKRMFEEAVSALAAIDNALGIDPDEAGGAAPILEAIERLRDDGECRSCVDDKCVTGPECVTLGRDAACASERADAGKDAALTPKHMDLIGMAIYSGKTKEAYRLLDEARAILAANKEKP